MPNFRCPRGHVINLSPIPTPGEFFYGDDALLEHLIGLIATAVKEYDVSSELTLEDTISDTFAGRMKHFNMCQQCGALVFPDEEPPLTYVQAGGAS